MSKKNKQKLQKLIAKKKILQKIEQAGAILSFTSKDEAVVERKLADSLPQKSPILNRNIVAINTPTHSITRDLRRTTVSLIIIAILLVGAAIASGKTSYGNTLGNWMYQILRLNS